MEPIKSSPPSHPPSAPPWPPESHQLSSPIQPQNLNRISSLPSIFSYGQPPAPYSSPSSYAHEAFSGAGGANWASAPGMNPWIIQWFRSVDRDGSGFIDESELQIALSQGNQKFSIGTVRLLMFLFSNPRCPSKAGENSNDLFRKF